MNLFYNPSLGELQLLIAQCNDPYNYYDILVDYNGKVSIELSAGNTKEIFDNCKFYLRGFLRGRQSVGEDAANNRRYINQLYKNLVCCWENNLQGPIDHNDISRLQNITYWLLARKKEIFSNPADHPSFVFTEGKMMAF